MTTQTEQEDSTFEADNGLDAKVPEYLSRTYSLPSVTSEVKNRLLHAFSIGCSDKEAVLYAGIGLTTLYDYQRQNPSFGEQKKNLKQNPVLMARKRVVAEVSTNTSAAQWYLERKARSEFGQQVDVNVNHFDHLTDSQIRQRIEMLESSAPQITDETVLDAEVTETPDAEPGSDT